MLWDLFGKFCARVGKKLFHFGYNLLSKLVDRIIPLDDSEKNKRKKSNVHNKQKWEDGIKVDVGNGYKKGKTESRSNIEDREDREDREDI